MKRLLLISIVAFFAVFLCSCEKREKIRGEGRSFTQEVNINLRNISEIEVNSNIDVEIVPINPSEIPQAEITAQHNIMNLIVLKTIGNTLKISFVQDVRVIPTDDTKVTLFMPYIRSIKTNSSGDIYCFNGYLLNSMVNVEVNSSGNIHLLGMQCNELLLKINGSGKIFAENISCATLDTYVRSSGRINVENFDAHKVYSHVSGSGSIFYRRGRCLIHNVTNEGSGSVDAYDLFAENVSVESRGSGNIYVFASNILEAFMYGSGNLYFRGNPRVYKNIYGSGDVFWG